MRSDQFFGLNKRAQQFLQLDEQVKVCEVRTLRRYPDGSETDSDWIPEFGTRTKQEHHVTLSGAWDKFQLYKYTLIDGTQFFEAEQAAPWSSGPMIFTALKDGDGNWVKESLWTNDDPETEGQLSEESFGMTPEQEKLMAWALGDDADWPKFTDDAEVNYEIDRRTEILTDDPIPTMPPWNEASLAEKAIYLEEISEVKTSSTLGGSMRVLVLTIPLVGNKLVKDFYPIDLKHVQLFVKNGSATWTPNELEVRIVEVK